MPAAEISRLTDKAVELLKQLITTPSFSKEEQRTALLIESFLKAEGIQAHRSGNNIWAVNHHYDPKRPTLLLNSHHDTVRPNPGYTRDPFNPAVEGDTLFGLGSNDAGGPLVSLISAFIYFYSKENLPVNLVLAATAEEEISGTNGIESIFKLLPKIDYAIVGEPTKMEAAIAEKGLLVLDCVAHGKAGHAARNEGDNAIYNAIKDIEWFRTYEFPKVSERLGMIKMSVTIIQAGQAHNQVPAECRFTVDIRVTEQYTLEEVLDIVLKNIRSTVTPRSLRIRPSGISPDHPLVAAAVKCGLKQYGSPTTSDQALIPVPSIKIGPGDSARSHSADEYIRISEVRDGIRGYIQLIEAL
ncbi:MAG: M20 family metallo-hydrolase [Bacteroidetes bacterium]|nr:M20 family metallo-hydrolase [Bacteroidota bacterium]